MVHDILWSSSIFQSMILNLSTVSIVILARLTIVKDHTIYPKVSWLWPVSFKNHDAQKFAIIPHIYLDTIMPIILTQNINLFPIVFFYRVSIDYSYEEYNLNHQVHPI